MKLRGPDATIYRKTMTWPDQHGRPYEVIIDQESMTWCAPPIAKFRTPLEVPISYLVPERDATGEIVVGSVVVDYPRWFADWSAAERGREQTMQDFRVKHPHASDADLVGLIGDAPQSSEFVRAARAGNRWVLGLPSLKTGQPLPVPPWAEPILDRLAPRTRAVRLEDPDRLADAAARYADVDEEGASAASMGFADAEEDAMDADTAADLDEQYDTDAVGGARIPVRSRRRQAAKV